MYLSGSGPDSPVRKCAHELLPALIVLLAGCGADAGLNAPKAKSDAGSRQCYGANDCTPGHECNELGFCVPMKTTDGSISHSDGGLPPEVESKNKSEPPATGKRFVYVAVPTQDMVAKIDSETLQVHAVKVGTNPGVLQTVKGQDIAVVLNRGSATASLLRSKSDGSDEIITLKTVAGLNQLALAPGGTHGIAYFDLTLTTGNLPPKQTLQEITLLRLEAGKETAINLPVGFRPSSVLYTADGSRGYIVTEQGISVIELALVTKPTLVPTIPLLKDPLKEPKPAEVVITPDGKLALLRQPGVKGIRAVDLSTKAITDLPLGAEPTDLDLTAAGDLAVVVLRDSSEVALIDLPGDLQDPTRIKRLTISGYTVGQATLSADSKQAFLFSNATTQEAVLLADLQAGTVSVFTLKKGVRAVYGSPDGAMAIVLHNKVPGTASPAEGVEAMIDKSWGYSLLSLSASFVKLQLTDADPGQLAIAPDSASAWLLLADATRNVRSVEAIDLSSFLVDSLTLGSLPVSVGIVPTTQRVYVAQSHPLGRVTFIDMSSHQTRTVTGFELNSYVIE